MANPRIVSGSLARIAAQSGSTFRRIFIALAVALASSLSAQELYVGANYHPHDSNPETWRHDIGLMKAAGFRVVRMGHLAWDSYEPSDGNFTFAWFDQVMDMMNDAGIKVVLDVAVRPAPLWLHQKYPSIDITDSSGSVLYPNHRYMVDVGDPAYQKYALRFVDVLSRRYAKHPALLAFGIDNEPGDGPISYSTDVKLRFISWLQAKYGTLEALNAAWASQRWSRRIGAFGEVGLPFSGKVEGQPERVLDFRRFISDETSGFLRRVIAKVNENAPGVLTTTNMWYYSSMKYFDYSGIAYDRGIARGGCGFYPGNSLQRNEGIEDALFGMARIQFENDTPFWCTEFTTHTAVPGSIRKSAYASLMQGNQMVCGWTWQSMHGGEEQFLQGMVDWDGIPNRKYEEYRQIAEEFKKIGPHGFPYHPHPEVALAFSFDSQIASAHFPEAHDAQIETCFATLNEQNIEARIVEISRSSLHYKLLVVPGVTVMNEPTATKIREFVRGGGCLVMTGYSDMLDEHGQVFSSTLPGRLSDVFGIRISGFEETEQFNELSKLGLKGNALRVALMGQEIDCDSPRFDVIHPQGAEVIGKIVGLDHEYPIVTSHPFGAGLAIYVGLPGRKQVLGPLLGNLVNQLGISKGPSAPSGVMARQIDASHVLYLNLEGVPKRIKIKGKARSLLYDRDYEGSFGLDAFQPDFVECD
jgi:beta-galactosidase